MLHDLVSGKYKQIGAGVSYHQREEQEIMFTCQVRTEMEFGMTVELVEVVDSDMHVHEITFKLLLSMGSVQRIGGDASQTAGLNC